MSTDSQGNRTSTASRTAQGFFDQAVDALNVYQGDPVALADAAITEDPSFTMAHVLKAYLFGLSTEPEATSEARNIVAAIGQMRLDDRERSHLTALRHLVHGDWTAAAELLNRHNAEYPRDLLGLQAGHLMDFNRASARNMRDRIARTLPHWSADVPGYAIVLGMYAFGFEETGDYGRAEEFGRRAVALDPRDCWAHHAVAHVMEMQGRAEDGIGWMIAREPHWSGDSNFFKIHNWWHRSLYHLDLGQSDEVLRLYDGPIRGDRSGVALDLVDAASILWRLAMAGHDVGDRWAEVAEAWDAHADGRTYPFNDWHAVMAYLGAGREGDAARICERLRSGGDLSAEVARWGRQTGLPLAEGFTAFWRGDFETAVERLHGARYIAGSFGGSHAQRDIIDWTLTEAALRGGIAAMADAIANERVALKPHSPINRDFVVRARTAADSNHSYAA